MYTMHDSVWVYFPAKPAGKGLPSWWGRNICWWGRHFCLPGLSCLGRRAREKDGQTEMSAPQ